MEFAEAVSFLLSIVKSALKLEFGRCDMSSLRKQIADLERRISILENARNLSGDAEAKSYDSANESVTYKTKVNEWARVSQKKPDHLNQNLDSGHESINKAKSKLNEALVGRYIVGALASLLVFVGAVSLVALFWGQLTPQMKLCMLVSVGVILTSVGLLRIRKHNNPITAIILGTGSGLLFISILAANLAFALISSATAYLLAGIWSISFMLIYGFTKTFFTTLIAYIGSYIAMGMGIYMAKSSADLCVVLVFTLAVILVMIGSSKRWLDTGKQLICTALSWFSIISLIYGGINSYTLINLENTGLIFGLPVLVLYVVLNRFCYLNEKSGHKYTTIVLAILTGLITIVYTNDALSVDIGTKGAAAVLLCIYIAQFLFNEWKEHPERKQITVIFSIFQGFAALLYMMNSFELLIGFSIPACLLLTIGKLKQRTEYRGIISTFIFLDSFLIVMQSIIRIEGWTSNMDHPGIYCVLIVILIFASVLICMRAYSERNGENTIVIYKISSLTGLLSAMYGILVNLLSFVFEKSPLPGYIGLTAVTFTITALFMAGYFKDWKNEQFRWFDRSAAVSPDGSGLFSYYAIALLYFGSITSLYNVTDLAGNILLTLTALCLALMQSANIMMYYRNNKVAQVWLGLKYLILVWVILFANSDLEFTSVYVSITGLSLALLSIAAGFKLKLKGLRLYGLILTILMVLKFIAVDLNQENSITRVVMLMAGGLICFGISVLYNRLENLLKE